MEKIECGPFDETKNEKSRTVPKKPMFGEYGKSTKYSKEYFSPFWVPFIIFVCFLASLGTL